MCVMDNAAHANADDGAGALWEFNRLMDCETHVSPFFVQVFKTEIVRWHNRAKITH